MPSLPPQPDPAQPPESTPHDATLGPAPAPEWPPHLAAAIAVLDGPHALTSSDTEADAPLRFVPLRFPVRERQTLYLRLAYPVDESLAGILLCVLEIPDVLIELVGRVDPPSPAGGWLFAPTPPAGRGHRLQVWRARAFCRGAILTAEGPTWAHGVLTWHPRWGNDAGVLGLGPAPTARDRDRAFRALEVLLGIMKRPGPHPESVVQAQLRLIDAARRSGLLPEQLTYAELNFQLHFKRRKAPYTDVAKLFDRSEWQLRDLQRHLEDHPEDDG